MYVLQTAVAIVGWRDAKVGLHCRTPSLRQVLHAKLALEQSKLEIEAQHDVQIVGDLVRVGANKRSRHLLCMMERCKWNA